MGAVRDFKDKKLHMPVADFFPSLPPPFSHQPTIEGPLALLPILRTPC